MFVVMRMRSISEFARIVALTGGLVTASVFAAPQAQQHQDPAQTGPIDEPRGAEEKPRGTPVVKGEQAIRQIDAKCSTTLVANAEALFQPRRWTFNPDAAETMDIVAPMIAKAGRHPAHIVSYAGFADSDSDSQTVSEKRAITVRGWLVNHGFVTPETPIQAFVSQAESEQPKGPRSAGGGDPQARIEIVIDTCR